MNKKDVRKLLALISSSFPNFRLDEKGAILAAWEYHLKGYEVEEGLQAVKTYIESGKEFAPSPGTIVSILRRWAIRREKISSWEEAFFIAERIARQYGKSHPRDAAQTAKTVSNRLFLVIKQFGYKQLCDIFPQYDGKRGGGTDEDIKYAKIKFEKLWRELTQEIETSGYIGYQETLQIGADPKLLELAETTAKQVKGIE